MATGRRVVKTLEVPSCAESLSEVVLATGTVAAELRLDPPHPEPGLPGSVIQSGSIL